MIHEIIIHRPVEDVYRYYVKLENFAQWSESITKVERENPGEPQPGESFMVHVLMNGLDLAVAHRVIAIEPGQRFLYGCDWPIPCQWDVTFEPVDGGTRLRVSTTMNLDMSDGEMRKRLPPAEMLEAKEQASLRAIKAILEQS